MSRAAAVQRRPGDPNSPGSLKTFAVQRFHIDDEDGSTDMYEVKCPHCKQPFWVRLGWMIPIKRTVELQSEQNRVTFKTRPCPYCFRTSNLPKRKKRK